jgi:hypothetical protein
LAYQQQGQEGRAIEELTIAVKMSGEVTFASAALGHLYGSIGEKDQAITILDELTARSTRAFVPSYDTALVCTGLGWHDRAVDSLLKAHQERSGWITYIKVDPRLDALRKDARFVELLHRVHLA